LLKFSIDRKAVRDSSLGWTWTGRSWRHGASTIEPYDHPALNHEMVTDGAAVAVISSERGSGCPPRAAAQPVVLDATGYRTRLREAEEASLDTTVVEMAAETVTVRAGLWAVAPLYLVGDEGRLQASWDLADLRGRCRSHALVDREIARLLRLQHRYGHDTPWQDVYRLTERSTASWTTGNPTLCYPPGAAHTRPRALRPGVDVIDAYEALLDRAVNRRHFRSESSAVELSGGMDSANVAASLATAAGSDIAACAMLLGGAVGDQQVRRRLEMSGCFGLTRDIRVDVMAHLPLSPAGRRARGEVVSPYDDTWTEAEEVMMRSLSAAGIRWSFGGTGGDELTSLREEERSPAGVVPPPGQWVGARTLAALDAVDEGIAPSPVLYDSTLLAFACRSPQFMRNGLWPVSPLADPELIRFAEWLPRPWREHKALNRLRLARLGLSPETVHPRIPENFVHPMNTAMRRYAVPFLHSMVRGGGLLIEAGFVDGDGLAATVDAQMRVGPDGEMDRALYHIASIELGLRRISGGGA
jgi:asparagine synthase (glutamine-hydrolysing)